LQTSFIVIAAIMISLTGCKKDLGPAGADGKEGKDGVDGINGVDANETCKLCHTASLVDKVITQFELSKHSYGETAFTEQGNTTCAPCHEQEGFRYVCANNVSTAFTWDAAALKWVNPYASSTSSAYGDLKCFTCHSSLHTTYGYTDLSSLTTTAAVPLTMYGGAKTINLTQGGGKSNLCVKCHQPRPMTCSTDPAGRLLNYDSLRTNPTGIFFDSAGTASSNPNNKYVKPSYRMHIHYGAVSAIYAGVGGIEYSGSVSYTNSPHASVATCQDCHMAPITGNAGGHSFSAKGNFNGCNATSCHGANALSATAGLWVGTRADVKDLLDQLATKINACGGGHDILHADADPATNLWAGISTGNYDGYLDIYSSSTNPNGYWRDPYGSGATNAGKPKFPKLLNVQVGALINFQLCLREYSLGIHNTQYVTALLTNTVEALTAAGL